MQIHIRVVAPAFSLGVISPEVRQNALDRIRSLGWHVSLGKHVLDENDGSEDSVSKRVEDIHQALTDPTVTHLMSVLGGWDSHELLPFIDWGLWRRTQKPLIGYSDVTSLQNAAYVMANVKCIHGPALATLGQPSHLEFTTAQLVECVTGKPYRLGAALYWIDDEWFLDPSKPRVVQPGNGYAVLQYGTATGVAVGGNLSTFMSLAGTMYWPNLDKKIVFLEDIKTVTKPIFRRLIQQLFQQSQARMLRAIVFGRMPAESELSWQEIVRIVKRFVPSYIPVMMNASFGHTYPVGAFPIGREVTVKAYTGKPCITVN